MQTYTDDQVRTMVNLILNEGWPQKKAAESVGIHVKSASYYVGQERKRRIDAARAAVLEPTLAITPPVEQHVEQAIAIPMPPPSEALRQTVAETVDHPPHYFRGGIEAIDVIGALIGGFLLSFFFNTAGGGFFFTLLTAVLGSVILLWVVGKVRSKT